MIGNVLEVLVDPGYWHAAAIPLGILIKRVPACALAKSFPTCALDLTNGAVMVWTGFQHT